MQKAEHRNNTTTFLVGKTPLHTMPTDATDNMDPCAGQQQGWACTNPAMMLRVGEFFVCCEVSSAEGQLHLTSALPLALPLFPLFFLFCIYNFWNPQSILYLIQFHPI